MSTQTFRLAEHPWLVLLIVGVGEAIGQIVAGVLIVGLLKRPREAPATQFLISFLGHVLLLFALLPFVLGLPARGASYGAYLDAIRLTRVRPLIRLLLLGLSCYLILALCQASGVVVYRALEGKPITGAFLRGILDVSGELPPKSWGWLVSLPSALEEVAFRGVVLSVFLLAYPERPAILFAALGFGAMHLLNLASGRETVWVLGQVAWSAILGLFYGFVVVRSDSLLPAMAVHYLGNLFVGSINVYLQANASVSTQALYGISFTFGVLPTVLMSLWVIAFTALWPVTS
jgi:membrane protease YdiL (CAAX protease family)